jgi:hypothetical protein
MSSYRSASLLCQVVNLLKNVVFYGFILMVVLKLIGMLPSYFNSMLMYYMPLGFVGLYIVDYALCEVGPIRPATVEYLGGRRRR